MPIRRLISAVALLAIALYTQWLAQVAPSTSTPSPSSSSAPLPDDAVRIARVVDGDTIELEGGTRVRFIGVNTPETVDPRRAPQCFGAQASAFTKALLADGVVILKKDISNTDKYGRLLRYLYLPDGTFVNLKLVAEGYAYASTYPPDIAHAREFADAQAAARQAGRGLWGACPAKP